MKDFIEEFEKTGYIAWINADIYSDGRIYTQEFTEWLAKKVTDLQPTNSTECIKSDVVQSFYCNSKELGGTKCSKQCEACDLWVNWQ